MAISHLSLLLLHILTSVLSLLLPYLLRLPSLLLHSLHTYIHPDHLPSSPSDSTVRAAIRRPSDNSNISSSRSKSKSIPQFDESKAQLFRLRLSGPHVSSRLHFPSLRLSFLLSSLSLSNLSLHFLLHATTVPFLLSLLAASTLSVILFTLSLDRSAHKKSIRRCVFFSAAIGFFASLLLLSSHLFDFPLLDSTKLAFSLATISAFLLASLFSPAARAAKSFWLGTDQLRWHLSVVSCGPLNRAILYLSAILTALAPLLWFHPVASGDLMVGFKKHRNGLLYAAALLQVLALRPNVQMYLNEAVLCWYQRLHASRVPDLDYGRAKVFLHNHYICLVATQFFVPPAMVMILLGLSQMRGNLFADCSDVTKECALFLAWWIVFVQSVVMMSNLALYRMGFLFVS